MTDTPTQPVESAKPQSRFRLFVAGGFILGLILVLLIGKFGGFFDPVKLGDALGQEVRTFADGPFGLPVLILAFCVSAFIAVPQFVLIGVAIYAFGPGLGSVYSWIATLVSGAMTYWLGVISGQSVLARFSSRRLDRFAAFVGRNAFAASAIVRNIPTGPFLVVNMAFGALRASFWGFLGGMAVGVIPKIAVVGFAGKGIRAAVEGNPALALIMIIAAVSVLGGLVAYVRHRRRKGENIALSAE